MVGAGRHADALDEDGKSVALSARTDEGGSKLLDMGGSGGWLVSAWARLTLASICGGDFFALDLSVG